MTEPDARSEDSRLTEPADEEFAPSLDSAAELASILDRYMADLQAGSAPDRRQLLRRLIPSWPRSSRRAWPASSSSTERPAPRRKTPATLGEFRIIRELGRGGMGVVYEAEQTSLRRQVALKVLRFGVVADEDAMNRFRREAETVARLHHTNIVPIFAVGCERGRALLRHAVYRRAAAWPTFWPNRSERGTPVSAEDVGPLGPSGGRGAGACPSARGDPSRHQAFEPAARP